MIPSSVSSGISFLVQIGICTTMPLACAAGASEPFSLSIQPRLDSIHLGGDLPHRSKSAVAKPATPLGRYKKSIADAVGSRWYSYIQKRSSLITAGEARMKFYVNQQGRIEDAHLISNTSNIVFATLCMRSVNEAKIPPPPPRLFEGLNQSRLEIVYNFNLYPK
jgi:hypothetical protein